MPQQLEGDGARLAQVEEEVRVLRGELEASAADIAALQAEKAAAIERLEAEKAGAVASLELKLQEAEEYSQHLEAEHSDGQVRSKGFPPRRMTGVTSHSHGCPTRTRSPNPKYYTLAPTP